MLHDSIVGRFSASFSHCTRFETLPMKKLHKAKRYFYQSIVFGPSSFTLALCLQPDGATTRDWKKVTCKNCRRMR